MGYILIVVNVVMCISVEFIDRNCNNENDKKRFFF